MHQDPNEPRQPNSYNPYYQNQMPPPPPLRQVNNVSVKPKRNWGCISLGIAAVIVCATFFVCIVSTASQSPKNYAAVSIAPTDTLAPTKTLTWSTLQSFKGSGIKKTAVFSVPNDWKIQWTCTPSSFYGNSYNVQVYVYNSDATLSDVVINEICKAGTTSGETEEHSGGSVYLDINSEGDWGITVQGLQ